jgi:surfactin synthase thioesterase subunit
MSADECEFFSQDYCCPPDYIVKAGFVCPDALPIQEGDITHKCGGSNDKLMTEEEWEEWEETQKRGAT